MLERLGVRWICVTAGSPYYNPHVQRPAMFPPLDGYEPPEDPLRGVARQIEATAPLKRGFPHWSSSDRRYSYLQEWLPHVAQHACARGCADFVGLGRMVLSYPELPADVLAAAAAAQRICRTFSDCTTGPRMGLVSGCYPLDQFYTARPEAIQIRRRCARHDIQGAVAMTRLRARSAAVHRSPAVSAQAAQPERRLHRPARRRGREDRSPARTTAAAQTIGYSFFDKTPGMHVSSASAR